MSTGQSIAESVNLAIPSLQPADHIREFEWFMQQCAEGLKLAGESPLANGVRLRMEIKKEVMDAVSDNMKANGVVLP